MKNVFKLFLASLVAIGVAGIGFAAEGTAPSKPAAPGAGVEKKAEPTKTHQLTGDITSLDAKAGTLTVKGTAGEKKFTAEEKAKSSLGKVKVGDRVKVTYIEKNGNNLARSISQVKGETKTMSKPAAPATPETKETTTKPPTK